MTDYNQLVNGVENSKNLEEYFLDFFSRENLKKYEIPEDLKSNEIKAIQVLFKSKKDIRERIEKAFEYDPLCLEAFFTYMMLTEDLFLYYRFESYYKQVDQFYEFSIRQQRSFIQVLEYYVDFLIDISNITKAIKITKTIIKLSHDYSGKYIETLAKLYHYNEEVNEFYRLYQYNELGFKEYLLLLLTLLKNDDETKANIIAKEMFEKFEYSDYLDHLWDLDDDDPKQKYIHNVVEENYDDLIAVPDFFSYISRVKNDEKNN